MAFGYQITLKKNLGRLLLCVLNSFFIFSVRDLKCYQFGTSVTLSYAYKDANRIEGGGVVR